MHFAYPPCHAWARRCACAHGKPYACRPRLCPPYHAPSIPRSRHERRLEGGPIDLDAGQIELGDPPCVADVVERLPSSARISARLPTARIPRSARLRYSAARLVAATSTCDGVMP